ncbi:MAG: CotH kinase family protein [Clostridia bacterium]|nr:CotH kinase family protein [Clostridia bacterium]
MSKLKHTILTARSGLLLGLGAVLLLCILLAACKPVGPGVDGTGTGTDTEAAEPSGEPTGAPTEPGTDPSGETGEGTTPIADIDTGDATKPATGPVVEPIMEPADTSEPAPLWYPGETRAPSEDETSVDEPETTDPDHPGDVTPYEGLMFSKVYGTGKKNTDAAISNGFIQLYNASDKAVSLKGLALFYKTDGAKPYTRLVFPDDASVAPNGYYLVRASSPEGYDFANSVLYISGADLDWDIFIDNKEIRLVMAPASWLIDTDDDILTFHDAVDVFYASETDVMSVYAVNGLSKSKMAVRTALTDYSGYHKVNLTNAATTELRQLLVESSAGVTDERINGRLSEVIFSVDPGFYTTAQSLTLKGPDGYTIYYTTDGSDPRKSSTRKKYGMAIQLKDSSQMPWGPTIKGWDNQPAVSTLPGGYVIKAYATNGTDSTAVFINSYFIIPDLTDYNVPVISFSIPAEQMIGSNGFYRNYMPTGSITGERPRGLLMMEVFDKDGKRYGHSYVEAAVSGNGSSGGSMKSLRLYYKSANNVDGGTDSDLDFDLFEGRAVDCNGQAITSFDRLLIRNSGNDCGDSYIRDAYMQTVSNVLDVDTMATRTVLVFVNGEFWGVYNARERYSPEYVESHYGIDKENVAVLESDYSQVHTDCTADFIVSSGIEGDEKDFNDLYHFIRDNDLTKTANYQYVCEHMDIDSFIDMWVSRMFFVARDWPENNIKVWRNRNPEDPSGFDTKWYFTLLDMDMGLGFYDFTRENENFFGYCFGSGSVCGILMRSLIRNEDFKQQFIMRYYELNTEIFTPEYLKGWFDEFVAIRDPLVTLQHNRWKYSASSWSNAKNRIYSFIQNRQKNNLNHLFAYFGIQESDLNALASKRADVSYNENRTVVTINGYTPANGEVLKWYRDRVRFEVSAEAKEGFILTSIVWSATDGTVRRMTLPDGCTSAKAAFNAECSGTIAVYAKRADAGEAVQGSTLVSGATYTFYLDGKGDLYAWGQNIGGVLGLNQSTADVALPAFVMGNVAKVSTTTSSDAENGNTAWMTAILTKDGKLYTVGANGSGQLGRNGTNNDEKLGLVKFSGKIVDVSVGHDHMLILDENNVLWGVGNNSYGQIRASGNTTTKFVKVAEHVVTFSAGRRSTLYVDENGDLYGLGDNRWNKMVYNGGDKLTKPTLLLHNVVYVSSGEHQAVVVDANGDLWFGGWRTLDSFSQGAGNNPGFVKVMGGVASAATYHSNMVILTEKGEAYVYGQNGGNGIGGSVTGSKPKLFISSPDNPVIAVSCGYEFTAYLYADGTIRVQGDNSHGQAGTGAAGGSVSLVEVDF